MMHRWLKIVLALMFLPVLACAQANSGKVALVGARIIDGTGRAPIENGVLVIAVGQKGVVQIPPDARQIDLSGKTLTPALVDLHTHLGQTIRPRPRG